MRLLEVGHALLFALLTKDGPVPKPREQSPDGPGEGGVRSSVEAILWVASACARLLGSLAPAGGDRGPGGARPRLSRR